MHVSTHTHTYTHRGEELGLKMGDEGIVSIHGSIMTYFILVVFHTLMRHTCFILS